VESVEVRLDPETERQLKAVWWVALIIGVITSGLGVLVIVHPITGAYGLAILVALTLMVSGIGDILGAAQWRHSWVPILWGVISIGVGITALVWPDITLWALAALIGVVLIVRGLLRAMASIAGRPPVWGLWLVVGLMELGAGIISLVWPQATIFVLAIVIGIDLLIAGIAAIVFALRTRQLIT
jgi:uncharacterized membrane protein HdeD (DUF308 family)